ncbi:ANKRD29, partial [Symbiodinium microadriaticum]
HVSVIQTLHDLGVDIHIANHNGATPVYIAAQEGKDEVIELLHRLGGDVNIAKKDGVTPLYAAAWEGHLSTVMTVQRCGGDVNIPTNTGKTPLWIAAQVGYGEVIKFLHRCGANIDTPRNTGTTPITIGVATGHVAVMQLLIDLGADVVDFMSDLETVTASEAVSAVAEGVNHFCGEVGLFSDSGMSIADWYRAFSFVKLCGGCALAAHRESAHTPFPPLLPAPADMNGEVDLNDHVATDKVSNQVAERKSFEHEFGGL